MKTEITWTAYQRKLAGDEWESRLIINKCKEGLLPQPMVPATILRKKSGEERRYGTNN